MSTRKEARWSVRFFSLLTVDHEGYVQQTNKQNWTLHSNEDQQPCVATLYIYIEVFQPEWCISTIYHAWDTPFWSGTLDIQVKERSGKGNTQNVPEQLDLESSITVEIYSDYACLKVSRKHWELSIVFWNNLDLSSQSIRCKQSLQHSPFSLLSPLSSSSPPPPPPFFSISPSSSSLPSSCSPLLLILLLLILLLLPLLLLLLLLLLWFALYSPARTRKGGGGGVGVPRIVGFLRT